MLTQPVTSPLAPVSALVSIRTSIAAPSLRIRLVAKEICPPPRTRSSTALCSALSSSGMIGGSRPSTSAALQPNIRSAAGFHSITVRSVPNATIASAALSITARAVASTRSPPPADPSCAPRRGYLLCHHAFIVPSEADEVSERLLLPFLTIRRMYHEIPVFSGIAGMAVIIVTMRGHDADVRVDAGRAGRRRPCGEAPAGPATGHRPATPQLKVINRCHRVIPSPAAAAAPIVLAARGE